MNAEIFFKRESKRLSLRPGALYFDQPQDKISKAGSNNSENISVN